MGRGSITPSIRGCARAATCASRIDESDVVMALANISLKNAVADLAQSLAKWRLWLTLAREDIADQYRHTLLGPIWMLLNYLLFVGTLVLIFGTHGHPTSFVGYMAIGLLVWFYIADVINAAPSLFIREQGFIMGTALPLPVYVFRMCAQSFLRTSYAVVACIGMVLYFGIDVTPLWAVSLVGIVLIMLTTPAAILVLAMAGVYFPDFRFIVGHLTRLGFFLTPVFWLPSEDGGFRNLLYAWNPFTSYLEIVRAPILEGTVPVIDFMLVLAIGVSLWALAVLLLALFRKQVVFWL